MSNFKISKPSPISEIGNLNIRACFEFRASKFGFKILKRPCLPVTFGSNPEAENPQRLEEND